MGLALALSLALLPWWLYREYLSADAVWYVSDAAQLHYTRYVALGQALKVDHALPLWQRFVYSGGPFHANLENPTLYPPALVLAWLCPPLLAIHLLVLSHLSLAILGAFLLVRRLASRAGAAPPHAAAGALVGAAVFGLNGYTRVTHLNLVTYGAALALAPWLLWALDRLLYGHEPRRSTALLGLLAALQLFTGGLWVVAYSALALALWSVGDGLLSDARARRRALVGGAGAAVLAALIVQAKLQPFLEWVALTNRASALDWDSARGVTLGGDGDFSWSVALRSVYNHTGRGLPFALGLLASFWWRRRIVWLCLGLALLGFAVSLGGEVHRFLWQWVPPFDRIRDARRAWVLAGVFGPVLVGLGGAATSERLLRGARARRLAPAAGLALGCALVPLLEYTWRFRVHEPASFAEILSRYHNWNALAPVVRDRWRVEYAGDPSVLDPRGRNEQLVTTALGLETVAGYLGHAWPRALERHIWAGFRDPLSERRLKRLGILSVLGLVVGHSDPARGLEPPEIDGSGVLKNRWARPRVFEPAFTIGVFGDPGRDLAYALVDAPVFDPRRMSVVSFDSAPSPQELAALDCVLAPGDAELAPSVRAALALDPPPGQLRYDSPRLSPESLPAELLQALAAAAGDPSSPAAGLPATPLERPSNARVLARRPAPSRDRAGFVVVSELWTVYPGWHARSAGRELVLRPADGIATAVWLDAGEREIDARYQPDSVPRGLLLGALGLALTLVLLVLPGGARRAPAAD